MINTDENLIFISWTDFSKHTELFSKAINSKVFFISKVFRRNKSIFLVIDYLIKIIKSFLIIIKNKPAIVFVQNPPTISATLIVFFSKIFRFKTVIDSHNGAFEKPWVNIPFHKWALKSASVVTIHNQVLLKNLLLSGNYNGVNFHVINSKIIEKNFSNKTIYEKYFLVISSFASDEPMELLLSGIELFLKNNNEYNFILTGNYNRQLSVYEKFKNTKGIKFLGFVEEEKYYDLLRNSFGAISISQRNDVQQFALMECIGLEIPFISNNNETNKLLFDNKMILSELEPREISNKILEFINKRNELIDNVKSLKIELNRKWEKDFQELLIKLSKCRR